MTLQPVAARSSADQVENQGDDRDARNERDQQPGANEIKHDRIVKETTGRFKAEPNTEAQVVAHQTLVQEIEPLAIRVGPLA
jgi:hypothetical protein